MPAAWKNSATSCDSVALPRHEEPQPAAEPRAQLGEHQPVGHGVLGLERRHPAYRPPSVTLLCSRPTPIAQSKIFLRAPPSSAAIVTTRP